jgi:arylsulfatase A-like enzyme
MISNPSPKRKIAMIQNKLLSVALLFTGLILLGCPSTTKEKGPVARPNIIFFFTDDQGWQDLGSYGHPYLKTPNFDRLASEGIQFEQFYSSGTVCSPSRAAFMTGHYPARNRVHGHFAQHDSNARRGMPNWLDPDLVTIVDLLKQAGYRTGHVGKWHLGNGEGAPDPGQYGFDSYRTLSGPDGPGWDRHGKRADSDLARLSRREASSDDYFWSHSTHVFVEESIDFIRESKGQPFYLNVWAFLPHAPIRPTEEQLAVYQDVETDPGDFSSWMRGYAEKADDFDGQMKTYAAAITEIDNALGLLLDELEARGIADNTLIFFTSDNGPEDYHISNAGNSGMGSAGILRGRKRSMYEGGIRVPCIARWPGVIPAGVVDKTSVVAAVDWLPTVARLANVPLGELQPDGEDVSDIFKGNPRSRKQPLFWEWRYRVYGEEAYAPPSLAMREGEWKLFAEPDGSRVELYHILEDPEERTSLAADRPEVVNALLPKLLDWKASLPD